MKNGWDTQHSVNWESLVALGIQSIGIINGEKWVQFHRTGKGRFSFQSQSKAMPRNVQNFHTVALVWHISKVMLKILQARLNSMWTVIFQMFKLDLVKAKEWDQIANICWITEKSSRLPEKPLLRLYWLHQSLWLCGSQQTVKKFSKSWEYQTTLPASWEICMQVKKQQLELDMEQQTGSKLKKEYIEAVYCLPAYLTSMQGTSCEMLAGWSTSWNQDCW